MEKRQRFSAEFKREAIRMMQASGKPAAVVARELGVPRNRLYKWAQDAEKKGDQAFRGSGRPNASQDEVATLKRELARLKEENEILKKRRRTSRGSCREVRLDGGRARSYRTHVMPCPAGIAQRLLCVAQSPTCGPSAGQSALGPAHPAASCRRARSLWNETLMARAAPTRRDLRAASGASFAATACYSNTSQTSLYTHACALSAGACCAQQADVAL
jgi:transposase